MTNYFHYFSVLILLNVTVQVFETVQLDLDLQLDALLIK